MECRRVYAAKLPAYSTRLAPVVLGGHRFLPSADALARRRPALHMHQPVCRQGPRRSGCPLSPGGHPPVVLVPGRVVQQHGAAPGRPLWEEPLVISRPGCSAPDDARRAARISAPWFAAQVPGARWRLPTRALAPWQAPG